jgi:MFS family permease
VVAELFGVAGMGVVLGTLYTSIAITALFGPPIVGAIIDRTGSYRIGILFTIAATLAGFLVLLLLRPRKVPDGGEGAMRAAFAPSEI